MNTSQRRMRLLPPSSGHTPQQSATPMPAVRTYRTVGPRALMVMSRFYRSAFRSRDMQVIHRVPDKFTTRSRQAHGTARSRQKIAAGGSASILSACSRQISTQDSFATGSLQEILSRTTLQTSPWVTNLLSYHNAWLLILKRKNKEQIKLSLSLGDWSRTSREVGSVAGDLDNLRPECRHVIFAPSDVITWFYKPKPSHDVETTSKANIFFKILIFQSVVACETSK
jgi:hypothetical protein